MTKKYDESEGVWRTIAGRKVFIRTGQKLSDAMKESGKFPSYKGNKKSGIEKDEQTSSPRDVISYHLKKGEFDKAEKYMREYGLEEEREQFKDGLNYQAQKDYEDYLSKTALGRSMTALDEIDKLAGGDEKLAKVGREMGLIEFRKYMKNMKTQKNVIKGARGTDENNSDRYIAENNPNVKKPYKEARVDRYRSFDNGYVLHEYYPQKGIQKKAKEASIQNPNDIHYVAYDDIMNPSSTTRWYNGKPYTIKEANKINQKINDRNNIRYLEKKIVEADEANDIEDKQYYTRQLKLAEKEYVNKYPDETKKKKK